MAAPTGAGLTSTPNYHAFGPNQIEAALARAAAEEGSPFLAYRAARMERQRDTEGYLDNLLKRDAMASENALRLGALSQDTEILKNIIPLVKETNLDTQPFLEALVKRGVIGGIGRGAQFNDVNLMNNRAQAAQRGGEAVQSSAAGGWNVGGTPLLQSILGGGTPQVPTSVQAAAAGGSAGIDKGYVEEEYTSPHDNISKMKIKIYGNPASPENNAKRDAVKRQLGIPVGAPTPGAPVAPNRNATTPGAADNERRGRELATSQGVTYVGPGTHPVDGRRGWFVTKPDGKNGFIPE